MSPLALLKEGEVAEIISVAGPCRTLLDGCRHGEHLAGLGLRPGRQVEIVSNRGRGPVVVRLDESRIALGRGIAMKIYVRRNEP